MKKLVPERGAFNSLRQAKLHTSYVLSVELVASLRGGGVGGGVGGGGGVTLILSQQSTSAIRNYVVSSVLE